MEFQAGAFTQHPRKRRGARIVLIRAPRFLELYVQAIIVLDFADGVGVDGSVLIEARQRRANRPPNETNR